METATELVTNAQTWWGTLSTDFIILIGLFLIFFIIGWRGGKSALVNTLLSTYIAILLVLYFPWKEYILYDWGLLFDKFHIVNLIFFFIIVFIVQLAVSNVLEIDFRSRLIRRSFEMVILAISSSILILAGMYVVGIVKHTDVTTSFLDASFANPTYLFILLFLPLIGLYISAR